MSVPRNWRLQTQRYRLVGGICERCHTKSFPPRDVCPECETSTQTPFAFSGRGQVYSYSTAYHPPQGFDAHTPYTVALVRLEEGPLLTGQLTDVDARQLRVGMPVEMVTREMNDSQGYEFRPLFVEAVPA